MHTTQCSLLSGAWTLTSTGHTGHTRSGMSPLLYYSRTLESCDHPSLHQHRDLRQRGRTSRQRHERASTPPGACALCHGLSKKFPLGESPCVIKATFSVYSGPAANEQIRFPPSSRLACSGELAKHTLPGMRVQAHRRTCLVCGRRSEFNIEKVLPCVG
jgi:hypothetical protein